MAQGGDLIYSKRWATKNIELGIYEARGIDEIFQSVAIAECDNTYKTHKVDNQILTITFEPQAEPSQDTQLVTNDIRAEEFETLSDLADCFKGFIGVGAKIENGSLIIESDIRIAFSENEPGLIEALGLYPVVD